VTPRIRNIRAAVEAVHKCKAQHEGSIPVIEIHGKNAVWEGVVEVFAITGHPEATRCYGWAFSDDDNERRYVAVLELPPVDSPHTAVRAAIASGLQK
jgi:hypothetical protein